MFAPVTEEMVQNATNEEDLYIDDADDSGFQENFTESGAYAGRDYVDMPKSRVRGFFGKLFHKTNNDTVLEVPNPLYLDSAQDANMAENAQDAFDENGAEYYDEYGGEYSDASGYAGVAQGGDYAEYEYDEDYEDEYGEEFEDEEAGDDASYAQGAEALSDEYVNSRGAKYNGGAFSALKEKAAGLKDRVPGAGAGGNAGAGNGSNGATGTAGAGSADADGYDSGEEIYNEAPYEDGEDFNEYADHPEEGASKAHTRNSHLPASNKRARRGSFTDMVEEQSHGVQDFAGAGAGETVGETFAGANNAAAGETSAASGFAANAAAGDAATNDFDQNLPAEAPAAASPETPAEAENIEAFRNPMINSDVWFVALGAELSGNAGMKNFIEAHKDELRGAIVIELDGLGAGNLSMVASEGIMKTTKYSSRMKRFIRKATQATGLKCETVNYSWSESAAAYANKNRISAMHLVGDEGGKPAFYAQANDTTENVSEKTLDQNSEFVMELLRVI